MLFCSQSVFISMQHPAVGGYQVPSGSIPDCYTDFDEAHETSLLMMQCQCLQQYVLSPDSGAVFLTLPRLFFDALAFLTSVRHSYRARWLFASAETREAFQSLLVSMLLLCSLCRVTVQQLFQSNVKSNVPEHFQISPD